MAPSGGVVPMPRAAKSPAETTSSWPSVYLSVSAMPSTEKASPSTYSIFAGGDETTISLTALT